MTAKHKAHFFSEQDGRAICGARPDYWARTTDENAVTCKICLKRLPEWRTAQAIAAAHDAIVTLRIPLPIWQQIQRGRYAKMDSFIKAATVTVEERA